MKSRSDSSLGSLMPDGASENPLKLAFEVSELRYRRLFETAQDGILILDAVTGKIIDVNPFLLDLLDYPFESMIGLRLWEIGQFKDVAANEAAFEKLQTNEYIRYENLPLRTKAGQEIQVEFVSNVYFVGSDKVIQCNIRDISARSKVDMASRGRVATLELEGKAQNIVLAVLAHELRAPLAAISGATDLLELRHTLADAFDKPEVPRKTDRSAVTLIRRNIKTLVRLIDELLDTTQMAQGILRLKLETIDAHEVIRFAIKNFGSQLKGVGIECHLQARRSRIRGDSGKLEQVLSNLIGNGLKFTPRGGKVSIVTRNEEDGRLAVEVTDTGIGISPEVLRRIFLPFEQGDSTIPSRFGGLGLGLSIARTLVEAQDGTLEVESDGLGHGAKFTARFQADNFVGGEGESPIAAKESGQALVET